jgi:hypothetical protein
MGQRQSLKLMIVCLAVALSSLWHSPSSLRTLLGDGIPNRKKVARCKKAQAARRN